MIRSNELLLFPTTPDVLSIVLAVQEKVAMRMYGFSLLSGCHKWHPQSDAMGTMHCCVDRQHIQTRIRATDLLCVRTNSVIFWDQLGSRTLAIVWFVTNKTS